MNSNQRLNQLLLQTRGLSSTDLEGTALIERLRKEAFALSAWACREIDRITDERDEARRQVCVTLYTDKEMQRNHARLCGWDCFKENNDD